MRILSIIRVGGKATVTFINSKRMIEAREFDAALSRAEIEAALAATVPVNAAAPAAPVAPPDPPASAPDQAPPSAPPVTKAKRTSGRKPKGSAK